MQKLFNQRRNRISQMNEYRQNRPEKITREISDDLFKKCSQCDSSILYETWIKHLHVCPNCNFYHRLSAIQRLELLIDENSFVELNKKCIVKIKSVFLNIEINCRLQCIKQI